MGLRIWSVPRRKQQPTGFGKRLLAIRRSRGLTQVEMAKLAKTSQRAISYNENEAGFPPASAVIALAEALQVSADELLGLKPRQPGPLETSPELRRMWKKFQQVTKLPERDQRAVIRLINSLAAANQVTQTEKDHSDHAQTQRLQNLQRP
jgi:transcriptional regulator with XRE-family HTH domain